MADAFSAFNRPKPPEVPRETMPDQPVEGEEMINFGPLRKQRLPKDMYIAVSPVGSLNPVSIALPVTNGAKVIVYDIKDRKLVINSRRTVQLHSYMTKNEDIYKTKTTITFRFGTKMLSTNVLFDDSSTLHFKQPETVDDEPIPEEIPRDPVEKRKDVPEKETGDETPDPVEKVQKVVGSRDQAEKRDEIPSRRDSDATPDRADKVQVVEEETNSSTVTDDAVEGGETLSLTATDAPIPVETEEPISETDVKHIETEEIREETATKVPLPEEEVPAETFFTTKAMQEMELKMYENQLKSEKDFTKQTELMTTMKALTAEFEKSTNLPEPLKQAEKLNLEIMDANQTEEEEMEKERSGEFHKDVISPQNLLSGGILAAPETINAAAGGQLNMEIAATVDPTAAKASENKVASGINREDIGYLPDVDRTNRTSNEEPTHSTLGSEAHTDVMDLAGNHTTSTSTSANAMELVLEEVLPVEPMKVVKGTRGVFDEAIDVDNPKTGRNKEETALDKRNAIQAIGSDVPGFSELANRLRGQLISDTEGMFIPEEAKSRKILLAQLRKANKVTDVRVMAPPGTREIFDEVVGSESTGMASPDVVGTSGFGGAKVFVPGNLLTDLHGRQQGVLSLTPAEMKKIRDDTLPFWNEFRMGRTYAGVYEAERMPTGLLTNDKSNIKAGQMIREGVSQEEDTFGNFMRWLIHDKLDTSRPRTWRFILSTAAALGHNDLSQERINWLLTGNPEGSMTSTTHFKLLDDENFDPLDQIPETEGFSMTPHDAANLHAIVIGNPEPQVQYPSRNQHPSAATDNSIHPDGSSGPDRANRSTFTGVPSSVMNIPDPRYSKRGGKDVHNIKIATVRNPKYDPALKPEDPKYELPFISKELPDIGAGSKEVQAMIEAAESDRLLRSIPSKLYAPIHAQACDRYLGHLNYQRLGLPIEKYMKSYSQHPWGPEDVGQMYDWNVYTMALYGQMLYAFVTDIQMQRTTPVFDMTTPGAVGDEYMEINELITELTKYQQKADDRGARVEDAGAGARPLEDHLNSFFENESDLNKQNLFNGNATIIVDPVTPFPPAPTPGPAPGPTPIDPAAHVVDPIFPGAAPWVPGETWPQQSNGWPDPRLNRKGRYTQANDRRADQSRRLSPDNDTLPPGEKEEDPMAKSTTPTMNTSALQRRPPRIGHQEMNFGIKNKTFLSSNVEKDVVDRRSRMFKGFNSR